MIFKRDEKGLLHQIDVTLEQLAADGKNTNLLVAQHMYIVFTDAEQAAFDKQRKEAQEKLLAEKKAADEARLLKEEARARDIAKINEIQKAREAAETAKDNALALALEAVAELKQQVKDLQNSKATS